jgi:hypothetical protein
LHYYGETLFYGESYNGDILVDSGQRQIVSYLFGNDNNTGGNPSAIKWALEYVTSDTMTATHHYIIEVLNEELLTGRWVVGLLIGGGPEGHAIVVKSFDEVSGYYSYWDPWNNEEDYFSEDELLSDTIRLNYGNCVFSMPTFIMCN